MLSIEHATGFVSVGADSVLCSASNIKGGKLRFAAEAKQAAKTANKAKRLENRGRMFEITRFMVKIVIGLPLLVKQR
ncbi:MAG: hypothetical protein IPN76_24625 [Saprospiraceae bacterium]|nr:hypothetical protein [Saprospiraceae bacterium]